MKLKELIIQQYSSYDKLTGECNMHLDGNLNATLHAITIDAKSLKDLLNRSDLPKSYHLHYTITRPLDVDNKGFKDLESMVKKMCDLLSNDRLSIEIDFLKVFGYQNSAEGNRKNIIGILDKLTFTDKLFFDQFDAIETHFENTLQSSYYMDMFIKWKQGKINGTDKNKRFGTRLNVSKHSIDDDRKFLHGYESGITSLISFSDVLTFQNQQQIDYIKSYCPLVKPEKLRVGTKNHINQNCYLFSETLFELQNDFYRIRNTETISKLTSFFNLNKEITYFFPFRLTDPDWGYDRLKISSLKDKTIVTNPTNAPLNKSNLQLEFESIVDGYDNREVLSTVYHLIKNNKIDIWIPLYSDIFNILHQTTAEIFHFCKNKVFPAFNINTSSMSEYEHKVRQLTMESVNDKDYVGEFTKA